jgi:transcriptional regulator GlxA family with amidase domain
MTTRVWTKEKLNEAHPLPKSKDGSTSSWMWELDGEPPTWDATLTDYSDSVFVCDDGTLGSMSGEPPADVALAVILASKGLDSMEAMAREVERFAGIVRATGDDDRSAVLAGRERSRLREVAEMLRRGTVKP